MNFNSRTRSYPNQHQNQQKHCQHTECCGQSVAASCRHSKKILTPRLPLPPCTFLCKQAPFSLSPSVLSFATIFPLSPIFSLSPPVLRTRGLSKFKLHFHLVQCFHSYPKYFPLQVNYIFTHISSSLPKPFQVLKPGCLIAPSSLPQI